MTERKIIVVLAAAMLTPMLFFCLMCDYKFATVMCACDNAATFKNLLLRYSFSSQGLHLMVQKSEIFYGNKRHTQIFIRDSRRIFSLPLFKLCHGYKEKC